MRIALVHYSYAPVIGGVETVMAEHARLFTENGHDVTILCQRGACPAESPIALKIVLKSEGPSLLAHLLELLAGIELVFVHNILSMPFDPALTRALWEAPALLPDTRFIAWIHDLAACNSDYQIESGTLLAQANPHYRYIAVSELRRRQFEAMTGAPCRVIPNGINPGRFLGLSESVTELATNYRLLDRRIVLLQPTRLLRRKNVEFSLRVAASLKASGHDCCLLITGPPDAHNAASARYAEDLRALHHELDLGGSALFVHEHFVVSAEDLRSLYQLSDGLLFPSHQEGFGLPLLEGALHRIPVFCPNLAPCNEIMPGAFHLYESGASPGQVAEWIVAQLNENEGFDARKRVVRDHGWEALYEKFLAPLLISDTSLDPQ